MITYMQYCNCIQLFIYNRFQSLCYPVCKNHFNTLSKWVNIVSSHKTYVELGMHRLYCACAAHT